MNIGTLTIVSGVKTFRLKTIHRLSVADALRRIAAHESTSNHYVGPGDVVILVGQTDEEPVIRDGDKQ